MPSPQQFTYFQGGGFDCSLLSFLQIDRDGNVNVSRLAGQPHVTAGVRRLRRHHRARPQRIVFSGYLHGRGLELRDRGRAAARSRSEGKVKKLVPEVEQVTFSGRRGRRAGPGGDLRHRALRAAADARQGSR